MLRDNKILKPFQEINPTVPVCPFYQKKKKKFSAILTKSSLSTRSL